MAWSSWYDPSAEVPWLHRSRIVPAGEEAEAGDKRMNPIGPQGFVFIEELREIFGISPVRHLHDEYERSIKADEVHNYVLGSHDSDQAVTGFKREIDMLCLPGMKYIGSFDNQCAALEAGYYAHVFPRSLIGQAQKACVPGLETDLDGKVCGSHTAVNNSYFVAATTLYMLFEPALGKGFIIDINKPLSGIDRQTIMIWLNVDHQHYRNQLKESEIRTHRKYARFPTQEYGITVLFLKDIAGVPPGYHGQNWLRYLRHHYGHKSQHDKLANIRLDYTSEVIDAMGLTSLKLATEGHHLTLCDIRKPSQAKLWFSSVFSDIAKEARAPPRGPATSQFPPLPRTTLNIAIATRFRNVCEHRPDIGQLSETSTVSTFGATDTEKRKSQREDLATGEENPCISDAVNTIAKASLSHPQTLATEHLPLHTMTLPIRPGTSTTALESHLPPCDRLVLSMRYKRARH